MWYNLYEGEFLRKILTKAVNRKTQLLRSLKMPKKKSKPVQRNPPSEAPKKSRNFSAVLYPESSCLDEVIKFLAPSKFFHILHDKDLTESREPKKEHWHLIFTYGNPRSESAVRDRLSEFLGFQAQVEAISSLRSMCRYLTHMDNPEKVQYDTAIVVTNAPDDYKGFILDVQDPLLSGYELYLGGANFYDLAKFLGRDFIINHERILSAYDKMAYSDPAAASKLKARVGSLNVQHLIDTKKILTIINPAECDGDLHPYEFSSCWQDNIPVFLEEHQIKFDLKE